MALARSKVYRYFPIDSDTDITADSVELSLDNQTWTVAAHTAPSSSVQAAYNQEHPVRTGLTRYWVQILSGPAQPFAPRYGKQTVHGRITDNPEQPYLAWELDVPDD